MSARLQPSTTSGQRDPCRKQANATRPRRCPTGGDQGAPASRFSKPPACAPFGAPVNLMAVASLLLLLGLLAVGVLTVTPSIIIAGHRSQPAASPPHVKENACGGQGAPAHACSTPLGRDAARDAAARDSAEAGGAVGYDDGRSSFEVGARDPRPPAVADVDDGDGDGDDEYDQIDDDAAAAALVDARRDASHSWTGRVETVVRPVAASAKRERRIRYSAAGRRAPAESGRGGRPSWSQKGRVSRVYNDRSVYLDVAGSDDDYDENDDDDDDDAGDNADVYSTVSGRCPLNIAGMYPCTCRNAAKGIIVHCDRLSDSNALMSAFRELQPYLILETQFVDIRFDLHNSNFDKLHSLMVTFRKGTVKIDGNPKSYSFASETNREAALRELHFMQCDIDLGNTTLAKVPLKLIEFFDSSFADDKYNENWFSDLNVEQVKIVRSPRINHPIARKMKGILGFHYTSSGLKVLDRTKLPEDTSLLTKLDLSKNELTHLPNGIFDGMPRLKKILLAGNRFQSLEKGAFDGVLNHLVLLDVEANRQLQCSGIAWANSSASSAGSSSSESRHFKVKGVCLDDEGLELDL